MKDFPKRRRAY